jgi:hypothetical protein
MCRRLAQDGVVLVLHRLGECGDCGCGCSAHPSKSHCGGPATAGVRVLERLRQPWHSVPGLGPEASQRSGGRGTDLWIRILEESSHVRDRALRLETDLAKRFGGSATDERIAIPERGNQVGNGVPRFREGQGAQLLGGLSAFLGSW